jgi:outer membrane protein OmpA-like peptidoglycan-associated protein
MTGKHGGAALVVLTLLAGCETTQQAATSPDYQKTRTGAGIGAGVGAVAGLLVGGGTFQSALVGAAIGGIAGGAIGNYQDKQEAQLRSSMAGTGVEVVRKQDNITLDMPAGITFATNQSDLNSAFFPILDKVAATLVQYDQTMIEVTGYTDSTGSATYNQTLSQKRAQSVSAYLVSRGVRVQRLMVTGEGENHPIASTTPRRAGRRTAGSKSPSCRSPRAAGQRRRHRRRAEACAAHGGAKKRPGRIAPAGP